MARIKLLLYALVALGLLGWNWMEAGKALPAAPPPAAAVDGKAGADALAAGEAAVQSAWRERQALERATAQAAVTSEPLQLALTKLTKNDKAPAADAAEPLKAAVEAALASFPEKSRGYLAVVAQVEHGAIAVVPGHDPLFADSYPWLAEAVKAGPQGMAADVAGKKAWVYAAAVRSLSSDSAKTMGTVAVAFSRDAADLAGLVDAAGVPFSLVKGGAAVASSDKAHSDAAAKLPAGNTDTSRAFALPGVDGALAVVVRDAPAMAAAPAAPTKGNPLAGNLQLSLMILGGATVLFLVLMGGDPKPVPASPEAQPRPAEPDPELEPVQTPVAVAPEPVKVVPTPQPKPEPVKPPEPVKSPEPIATRTTQAPVKAEPKPEPKPEPVKPADPGESFADLFGSGAPPAPTQPRAAVMETAAAIRSAPPAQPTPATPPAPTYAQRPAPAPASIAVTENVIPLPPMSPPPAETTTTMSRELVAGLVGQLNQPEAIPLPGVAAPMGGSDMAIPLPPASAPDPFALLQGADTAGGESTAVHSVPESLLRAATPNNARPSSKGGPLAGAANAEELHFQDVYREFLATRERCGEPQENLTFEKFVTKLRKNKEQLVQKYACKSVRFQVYVKEGKAALKATPVKDA